MRSSRDGQPIPTTKNTKGAKHPNSGLTVTSLVTFSGYVTDLAQTNNASAWRCLEFLQLPASPYLWADESAPATGH